MTGLLENIVTIKNLDQETLIKLFNNEILAVCVPNYCSENICHEIAEGLLSHTEQLECYHHEFKNSKGIEYIDYGVDRFGVSFNTTYHEDQTQIQKYYNSAVKNIRLIRKIIGDKLSPFDRFRLEMDEIWPDNVGLAHFEGKKMFAGVPRIMCRPEASEKMAVQPHIDYLPSKFGTLIGQFAVNIYIKVSSSGGELELWDIPPLTKEQAGKLKSNKDWRSKLPESMLLKPTLGELIIFNSRRPHAVRQFTNGIRVSLQSFIGITNNKCLVFWS